MLVPSEAIVGMAELMGITVLAGRHHTRILREAHCDFWPEVGSGHRGEVKLHHLVNFWLSNALSGAQPNNGPRVLDLLWDMRTLFSDDETVYFKSVFLRIIRNLVGLIKGGKPISGLDVAEVRVSLGSARFPTMVTVKWPQLDTEDTARIDRFLSPIDLEDLRDRAKHPVPAGNKLYSTEVVIGGSELVAFAQFASKAEDDDLVTPSNAPPGSGAAEVATPDKTKPAGTGIHDGLQTEPPATKQTADRHKAQSATRKARKQRLREAVEFRLQVPLPPPIERTRHHGAHWADTASP